MGDEVYQELPQEGEVYEELNIENQQAALNNPGLTNGPPPVPVANRPLPQAPSLPERNPYTSQTQRDIPVAPALPAKAGKSTFFDQQSSIPAKRPAAALPPVPTLPAVRGADKSVSQAFQVFIQSKKIGISKAQFSTPWAKRADPSGQGMEFISLQGIDSNIPFVPPSILVKMPEATEVATGNYLRLFIPEDSSLQSPPQRATAGIELPSSNGTTGETPELVYDDAVTTDNTPQDTYDDVVQKPALSPVTEDTYDDVTVRQEDTYDDVTVKQEDTYDDVIEKPAAKKPGSVSEELMYDDVELSRGSNRNSPTPSGSSEASGKAKVDKKTQKLESQRAKKREKSVKHYKQFGIKMSEPYLQDLIAISASEKTKDKEMLQIAQGERLQLVVREHAKMKQGVWLVEKADGTMGLADASLFTEGEGEIYETC